MAVLCAPSPQQSPALVETLLDGVSRYRATVAILDITGVKVIDTQIASVLVRSAKAMGLLGAQVVLTGINPEIAQTLIHIGIDLRAVVTRATLQEGIAYALSRRIASQRVNGQRNDG